ncbi:MULTISPECIES: DUF6458 family protein [Streptomyces]|uniref:DUF6458 family protein n=2 Tax=Streptomyces TaxID=1883 RepID=A0ABW6FRH1_9ACTN|nr:DUF6458 family protein [Streptomyces chryseus]GGW96837.1 membrane protein [Streptomyces chryseus]GHB28910.1 membrane protein [Streptomyces chryseus]
MGLGGFILLIAGGAILAFATDWEMESVNLTLVGVIMMLVGIIGVAVYASVARRRRMVVPPTTTVVADDQHHHHNP